MKHLFLFFLAIPFFAFSQKLDVKNSGEKTEITFDGTYMVQKDTSGSGVITIQLIPTDQLQKELESKLGELQAEVANIDIRINELQDRKKAANREIKEVEKLQGKLQSAPKEVAPAVESKTVDPNQTVKKQTKKSKQ